MKKFKALLLLMMIVFACAPSFAADEVIRVGVLRFESKADGISQSNAESITDELTRMLTSSYSIAIIDRSNIDAIAREHRMNLAGLIDSRTAAQLGQAAGIQYLITGAITKYGVTEEIKKNDTTAFWKLVADENTAKHLGTQSVEKTENAEVTLDLRVIDVNTHEVVMSMAETGRATRTTKANVGNDGSLLSSNANVENVSLRDEAVSDAVSRIGQRIKETVAGEYPQVLRISGGQVFLSLGATSGVKVGNRYKISFEGEEILDMRGNVVGKETKPLAIVEVDDVKNDYSTARVVKRCGNIANIQRGDRVESTSEREIQDLIKRKAFPSSRPRRLFNTSNIDTPPTPSPSPSPIGASSVSIQKTERENFSTDPSKVIPTYGLPAGEASARERLHANLQRAAKNKNAYDRYVEMANSYKGDYLAMYQAGMIAKTLGRKTDAAAWFDKALSVNPNYEPAKEAKENLNKPEPKPSKTTKTTKTTKKRRK